MKRTLRKKSFSLKGDLISHLPISHTPYLCLHTHTQPHTGGYPVLWPPRISLYSQKKDLSPPYICSLYSLCAEGSCLSVWLFYIILQGPVQNSWSELSRPHSYPILIYSHNSFYVGSFALMLVIPQPLLVPALSTSGWGQSSPLESSS